jgi:hypothetical protein
MNYTRIQNIAALGSIRIRLTDVLVEIIGNRKESQNPSMQIKEKDNTDNENQPRQPIIVSVSKERSKVHSRSKILNQVKQT